MTARGRGPLAVAAYYGVLRAHAPSLVTPVPLLGYGVAPVLGYGAMAAFSTASARTRASTVHRVH